MSRIAVALFVAMVTCASILTAQQPVPRFEVASVKPAESRPLSATSVLRVMPRVLPGGRFDAGLATVEDLLWFAYDLRQHRIVGGPSWVRQDGFEIRDRFEISAKAANDAPADQIRLMVRSLLEDRFKLVTHMERREMQVLALVRARHDGPLGPGLIPMDECSPAIVNTLRRDSPEKYPTPGGGLLSGCSSKGLGDLAALLTIGQGTPVIDATGLTDSFYYAIRSQSAALGRAANTGSDLPALSTALAEQLGLRLQSRKGPVDVLVIDSVERPTPN